MSVLKGAMVGVGYFSQFHLDAWAQMRNAQIIAVCDQSTTALHRTANQFGIERTYTDFEEMLDHESIDFVDIVTRPDSHLPLVSQTAARGLPIICQKPLAPNYEDAKAIVHLVEQAGVPFMVHENFRFQPWYREMRRQIDFGGLGDRLHSLAFRCRTGDGWTKSAYLERQPYFREMRKFLIFETGVHFVDTFRFLAGEISGVYATLRQLNPEIVGEDSAKVLFEFESGATGVWDGNRFNESNAADARLTFGEALIEGNGGSIRLYSDGTLTKQALGHQEEKIEYGLSLRGFAGDCVFATQQHFVRCLQDNRPFETSGADYLKTLAVVEAIYRSDESGQAIRNWEAANAHH